MGSLDIYHYYFIHFNLGNWTLFYNGSPISSEELPLDLGHENTSVLDYNNLFNGSGKRHSIAGLQVTRRIFIVGHFMLQFDLTPGRAASEDNVSHHEQGNIRVGLQFDKAHS